MSEKVQVQKLAASETVHAVLPPLVISEPERDGADLAVQIDSASRLGHSLGEIAINKANSAPTIQRQENPEEDKEELQKQRETSAIQCQVDLEDEKEEETLQTKRVSGGLQRQEVPDEQEELQAKQEDQLVGPEGGKVSSPVEAAIQNARGGGQTMETGVQAKLSEILGHTFSGVRVHANAEADILNRQLQAKAFTAGQDIFFKQGAYDPSSRDGMELLTHELSHVMQQSSGRVSGNGGGMTIRPAGDAFEQEADALARQASLTNHAVLTTANNRVDGRAPIQVQRNCGGANSVQLPGGSTVIQTTVSGSPALIFQASSRTPAVAILFCHGATTAEAYQNPVISTTIPVGWYTRATRPTVFYSLDKGLERPTFTEREGTRIEDYGLEPAHTGNLPARGASVRHPLVGAVPMPCLARGQPTVTSSGGTLPDIARFVANNPGVAVVVPTARTTLSSLLPKLQSHGFTEIRFLFCRVFAPAPARRPPASPRSPRQPPAGGATGKVR